MADLTLHEEDLSNLKSTFDKERFQSLKKILGNLCRGRNMSKLVSDVAQTLDTSSYLVRKYAYFYILHYSRTNPDFSILIVNMLQKELQDKNVILKAQAIKMLSGFGVAHAIQKSANDPSPFVKAAVSKAIRKYCGSEMDEIMMVIFKGLLQDTSGMVLTALLPLFEELNIEYHNLQPHYNKLGKLILDMEPWGQIHCLRVLMNYVLLYTNSEHRLKSPSYITLMNMCHLLLYSTNIAVLIQVGKTYLLLYPSGVPNVIETLIKCLEQGTPEEEFIILKFLQPLCKDYSHVMKRFLSFFFVRYSDPAFLTHVKVDILHLLVSSDTAMGIVKELMYYVDVFESVQALSMKKLELIALVIEAVRPMIVLFFERLLESPSILLAADCLTNIMMLYPEDATIYRLSCLAFLHEGVKPPQLRASILSLLVSSQSVPPYAAEIFRKSIFLFNEASWPLKNEILNLGSRIISQIDSLTELTFEEQQRLQQMWDFLLKLAHLDIFVDIRDKARTLFAFKQPTIFRPRMRKDFDNIIPYETGTLSHLISKKMPKYRPIPKFEKEIEEPVVESSPALILVETLNKEKNQNKEVKKKMMKLDEFLQSD